MTSRLLTILSFSLLALGVVLQGVTLLLAQENPSNYVTSSDSEDVVCLDEIKEDVETLTNDVVQFLNEHYQSEEPNSQLYETAFDKYEEYRHRMLALVAQFGGGEGVQDAVRENQERETCRLYVEQQIETVRQMLRNHNVKTASAKKTYTLITKQKALNERLRELNRDFAELYASFKVVVDKIQNTVAK